MKLKLKTALIAATVASFGLLGSAAPAEAATCGDELDETCAVVGTVVCKVVAKGEPCLM